MRDLDAPSARQVAIVVELLLQFERLVARVRLARALLLVAELCNRRAGHGAVNGCMAGAARDCFFRGSRFLKEYLDLCAESGPPNFRSINLGLGSVYGQFMVSLGLAYG